MVVRGAKLAHAHLAAHRKELDLPGIDVAHVGRAELQLLRGDVPLHESDVALTDVRHGGEHTPAAEDLHLQVGALAWGPFSLPVVEVTSFDAAAMAIALGAGVALLRYHANMILVLVLAAVAGMAWRLGAA